MEVLLNSKEKEKLTQQLGLISISSEEIKNLISKLDERVLQEKSFLENYFEDISLHNESNFYQENSLEEKDYQNLLGLSFVRQYRKGDLKNSTDLLLKYKELKKYLDNQDIISANKLLKPKYWSSHREKMKKIILAQPMVSIQHDNENVVSEKLEIDEKLKLMESKLRQEFEFNLCTKYKELFDMIQNLAKKSVEENIIISTFIKPIAEKNTVSQINGEKKIKNVEVENSSLTLEKLALEFENEMFRIRRETESILERHQEYIDIIKNQLKLLENETFSMYHLKNDITNLSTLKMNDAICEAGRGMISYAEKDKEIFFILDRSGTVQKVIKKESGEIKVLATKKFEVGNSSSECSIITNQEKKIFLLNALGNQTLYLIDSNLDVKQKWEKTGEGSWLYRIIFIDKENFCAGYGNGILMLYNIKELKPFAQFLPFNDQITAFYKAGESELLVGDRSGRLYSCNWGTEFVNWETKNHSTTIYFIGMTPKSKHIVTASKGKTISIITYATRKIIHKIDVGSYVYQFIFSLSEKHLFVLSKDKLILYYNSSGVWKVKKELIKQQFNNPDSLQSISMLSQNKLLVGDTKGCLWVVEYK